MARKKLAEARNESDEARWFEQNQEHLLKLFEQARKTGSLRVGSGSIGITLSTRTESLRPPAAQKVMLRIPLGDLEMARRQAASKGLGYQTYIKMLLHEALGQNERPASRRLTIARAGSRSRPV